MNLGDIIIGYLIGWVLFKVYKFFKIKQPEVVCSQHKWVMTVLDKDLYCEFCNKTPGQL